MSKPVRHTIGWWAGTCLSAFLATAGAMALRHALQTPQPLKSLLPGEAFLYRWQQRSIFYKVLGPAGAPPLVLLHTPAVGACAHEMRHLVAPLARIYRVYAPDLPGFGLSDRPARPYSAALYSSLCQDFLRDVVQEPATLLASELSCNYAVAAAASSPDLCTALILVSPRALAGNTRRVLPGFVAQAPLLKTLLYPLLCTRPGFLLTHNRARRARTDFAQFYAQTHQLGAEHVVMALLAGKLVANVSRQLQDLRQPVLSIWGTQALRHQSTSLPGATQRQRCEIELIPAAGLAVHEEQPESVIAVIQRWQAETLLTSAQARDAIASPPQGPKPVKEAADQAPAGGSDTSPGARHAAPTPVTTEAAAGPSGARTTPSGPPLAYCVKCKQKREIQDAHEVTMKNGRIAVRGTCRVCGSMLNRIGRLT